MEIPNITLQKWKDLKEEGDIADIAKLLSKSEAVVYQIFRTGIAHVRDAALINNFYKERKRQVGSINLDEDQD